MFCAQQEPIIRQIKQQRNYYVSCIVLYYIIHLYGWDPSFTNIIKVYDKPKPVILKIMLYATNLLK
jgi:hypothetical protein